jgi:large subunit ribosomal protein L9
MATSEILLIQPVDGLGGEGDQVVVRAGYARNYLLPNKIAIPLNNANRKHIEALKQARVVREARDKEKSEELAGKISQLHIAIAVKTGEGGKMFGAVTAANLHEKIAEAGLEVDKKKVHLAAPIKTLGKHSTVIKLHPEVSIEMEFDVVSENPIDVAPEEE